MSRITSVDSQLKKHFEALSSNTGGASTGAVEAERLLHSLAFIGESYDRAYISKYLSDKIQSAATAQRPDLSLLSLAETEALFEDAQIRNRDEKLLRQVFNIYDSDRKGYILTADLQRVGALAGLDLSEEEAGEMVNRWASENRLEFPAFAMIMEDEQS